MKMKVMKMKVSPQGNDEYTVEIHEPLWRKIKFPCLGILIASLIFALLVGIGAVIIAGVWKPLENKYLVLSALFVVITIITAIVALKLLKPFAKMAFLKEIMQCSKCMICCDLCDDDNFNENQTQGNESQKGKTGKNDVGKDAASGNQQDRGAQNENNEPDVGEGSETQGGDNNSSGAQPKSNQDDEPCSIAKAKLDAEKDLIKKFCDTLVEL